jgi:hypothetical protein
MSNLVYIVLILIGSSACASSQNEANAKLESVAKLPDQLKECSGMVNLGDGYYLGNNDSGNPAELIRFSLEKPDETSKIRITGASNVDWEELASDDEFIYIGDTGNNSGNRKDLTVYRVRRDEVLMRDKVNADKILFAYPDQVKFNPSNKHNFDCEAMVCIGDSLFVFTKNRGNGKTNAYGFPKEPGIYTAKPVGSYDAGGLITGADYRSSGQFGELVLVGYRFENRGYHPFILYFDTITVPNFFESNPAIYTFKGKLQTETIVFGKGAQILVSNEEEHGDEGLIYRVKLE